MLSLTRISSCNGRADKKGGFLLDFPPAPSEPIYVFRSFHFVASTLSPEFGTGSTTMEGGELKKMPSRAVSLRRQQSGRQLERSSSILEPERYLRSNSLLLKSEEATVAPPTLSEPLVLGFEGLETLNVKPDDLLPAEPAGALHGVLENGMQYYVRKNAKPRDRAALALAVSVGSVLEEDGEQGVAHIVEHLAFSATKDFKNHDLVHFLESIGSEFGPCQNAYTSVDETVYEILVPVDKPEILSKALHVLAEFSAEVQASDEDLEKERGPVLEEWRKGRNASGRLALSYWKVLLEGSKYADRWTIGEEQVIKTVPGHRVRDFYHHWYQPENMAVIAVGDFSDPEDVVKLINLQFAAKQGHVQDTSSSRPLTIPTFPVPPHDEPRFSCYVDTEAHKSLVNIACKVPSPRRLTVNDVRLSLVRWMFYSAMNYRFNRISKQTDRPFFSCNTYTDDLVKPVMAFVIEAKCPEGETIQALEHMLIELARVRLHGFSEREIAVARAAGMAMIKSTYLQRDQLQSTYWRSEYVQHFLLGNALLSIEYETQLQKTLGAEISAAEVSKIADSFYTTCSCIIKTVEPKVTANEEKLKAIVAKVTALERQGDISTWNEQDIPDVIVKDLPTRGTIIETKDYPEFDATEITLSNGMKVCYKCTDFLDDQILMYGFAYGGLSEVDESDRYTCQMASAFADEIGKYGHKPAILEEMIADKLVDGGVALGYYTHSFEAESTTADLETALQLLHQLFVTKVECADEVVKMVLQMYSENIKAQDRDPSTAYNQRVLSVNYGDSSFYNYWSQESLAKVDPEKACQYFNDCYTDPSTFKVVMVGAIQPEEALPLIQQYLGGIPKPEKPVMEYKRESLAVVPLNPASHIIREEVRRDMVEAQAKVYLSFPINLQGLNVASDETYTDFMCKFLETKLYQVLRFKHGKIYGAGVWAHVGLGSNPFVGEKSLGHIAVNFSCDPDMAWKLVDLTLEEIKRLQEEEPPVNDDVEIVLELEQREYENSQEDNGYWLGRMRQAYQSPNYTGNLGRAFKAQDELRDTVRAKTNTKTMQEVLRHILPLPCTSDYKVVVLLPNDAPGDAQAK